ncbi:hypothetical protein [Winslowiella iniecta]|uniref:Uncharacterized protein n=1 Tax=Winslowiella iniecta TaxID=1560201 RepID=A0A0L7T3S1_9GAMM|nr:hypothetical protein [Winslowiella iniecta]KOC89970.1 hypothetical protein NG42_10860 [Winslowiella iniecta]KOC94374.1 hypothetical protein NG43_05510 [Winslowiella iniecta]
MKFKKSISAVMLLAALTMSGCSSYNSVRLNQDKIGSDYSYYKMDPPLYVGDKIKYKLKDGREGELTVGKVEPNTIVSDSGKVVAISDIASLERKDFSKGKTASLVGGGFAATTVILVVLVSAATLGIISAALAA